MNSDDDDPFDGGDVAHAVEPPVHGGAAAAAAAPTIDEPLPDSVMLVAPGFPLGLEDADDYRTNETKCVICNNNIPKSDSRLAYYAVKSHCRAFSYRMRCAHPWQFFMPIARQRSATSARLLVGST